ncbi:retropepsin-like domain-containing protein [Chloracidobacterium validum]|uniref:Retropepsin-like domain-containing protein n=1 Tax=Chloracidobacterium validum TaxID=2821543 RepID=A0ABX8B9G6_9BACT|nr:aspartyl protease family protein [Chloracidobacterium validum]QUW03077.1 retropepsin-like domain-containing protein [Chloracidobacterium validum]
MKSGFPFIRTWVMFGAWLVATLLAALASTSAAPFAAHRQPAKPRATTQPAPLPATVAWREDRRGLCLTAWVNDAGPFNFVIDTGAGVTLLSPRVARRAGVTDTGQILVLQGTGRGLGIPQPLVTARTLAIGTPDNRLPRTGRMVIADRLPSDVDGVLDPTEVFADVGYEIDFPNQTLSPLNRQAQVDGIPLRWLPESNGRRPFVRVGRHEAALIDTGSSFGLAIPASKAATFGIQDARRAPSRSVQDVAGNAFWVARVAPTSVWLESLYLEKIPTDLLHGADTTAPPLLGRAALRPFRIRFDLRRRSLTFVLPVSQRTQHSLERD